MGAVVSSDLKNWIDISDKKTFQRELDMVLFLK